MNHSGCKLATITLVTALAALSATAVASQSSPSTEGCRIWEAHITYVIEQHRREGTSEAALGRALDLAYAAYAQCVMGGCDMSEKTVAVLEVLSRGRQVEIAAR